MGLSFLPTHKFVLKIMPPVFAVLHSTSNDSKKIRCDAYHVSIAVNLLYSGCTQNTLIQRSAVHVRAFPHVYDDQLVEG